LIWFHISLRKYRKEWLVYVSVVDDDRVDSAIGSTAMILRNSHSTATQQWKGTQTRKRVKLKIIVSKGVEHKNIQIYISDMVRVNNVFDLPSIILSRVEVMAINVEKVRSSKLIVFPIPMSLE